MTSAQNAILDAINAGRRRQLRGYLRTNWSNDPYTFGAYSHLAKEASRSDRDTLRAPVADRIFFAGEAVHPRASSTVHAAYQSGLMAAEAVSETSAQNIAIIGAGMSGLAAAHALAGQDRTVTVFEARDRIGGRLWTNRSLGVPMDIGASWIHGTEGNPLTKLADHLGLVRVTTEPTEVERGPDGKLVEHKGLLAQLKAGGESWKASMEIMAGAEYDQLNLWGYLFEEGYDGAEVLFPGGYVQILDALKGDYEVRLGAPVQRIGLGSACVWVASGEVVEAFDAVVVTLPLGVLKRPDVVAFDPPLPKEKQAAIDRLGMGVLDKLCLLFDAPFWDREAMWISTPYNGLPQGQCSMWLNLYKFTGAPALMGFHGASAACQVAKMSDETLLDKALSVLDAAYPTGISI